MQTTEAQTGTDWEALFGCSIAILAAILAVCDLGAGRYGDDEMQLVNEKSAAYQWYQSKGIKENLAEGQKQLLNALLKSGIIQPNATPTIQKLES